MINNIIFDLGNVILKGKESIVLESLKIPIEYKKNIEKTYFNNSNELDLGNETLVQHFNNCKFDFPMTNEIKDFLLNHYRFRPFNNEIIDLMNKLKGNGYNIFILSNNKKETYEYLKNLPILKCVDGWVVSCSYHMVKPDKCIYLQLFNEFKLKPEECFFIDDRNENIETGKELGMDGFLFDNNQIDKLLECLRKKNILI